jgi:high-affinity Fe2+/Pb2+ permease
LLVAGCWLLVAGCWLLVAGCWLLVAGCWLLPKHSSVATKDMESTEQHGVHLLGSNKKTFVFRRSFRAVPRNSVDSVAKAPHSRRELPVAVRIMRPELSHPYA